MADFGLPVADRWYASRSVDDDLTVVWEPHVHPLLQANIWCLRSGGFSLVVDSGLGVCSLRDSLPGLFGGDCAVVITHAHLDHLGSAHEFEECWAHPAEAVGHPLRGTLWRRPLSDVLGLEISTDTPELLIDALPHAGYDVDGYALRPAHVTRPLRDGDRIQMPGRTLTVLHLPGHTNGSIALYEPETRSLFSGDVIYDLAPDEHLLDELHGSDVGAYVESMRRLLSLEIHTVYPGHGDIFGGARLRELVQNYLSFRGR